MWQTVHVSLLLQQFTDACDIPTTQKPAENIHTTPAIFPRSPNDQSTAVHLQIKQITCIKKYLCIWMNIIHEVVHVS